MRLEFDNLAVYAASIGVWKPIEILWDAVPKDGWYSPVYVDETWILREHRIAIGPEDPVEEQLKTLRHELEHARQAEELGALEWESAYNWELDVINGEVGLDDGSYLRNPFEIEANKAMNREWRELLPCVKGARP